MYQVVKSDAVTICIAMGFATAAKWKKDRMNKKMREIAEMDPDGLQLDPDAIDDKGELKRLNGILVAMGQADSIEVVKELPAEEPDADIAAEEEVVEESVVEEDVSEESAKEVEETKEEPKVGEEVVEEEPAPKKKKRGKRKKEAAVKESDPKPAKKDKSKASTKGKVGRVGPDVGTPKGVKSIRNRLFCAGAVLKQSGLADGITDPLIKAVEKKHGKLNPMASKTQLGYAWHVLNGYLNGE